LKYKYLNVSYCNCVRVPDDINVMCVMDEDIEEYIQGVQHSSNIVSQIQQEDLKAEKGMYGRVI